MGWKYKFWRKSKALESHAQNKKTVKQENITDNEDSMNESAVHVKKSVLGRVRTFGCSACPLEKFGQEKKTGNEKILVQSYMRQIAFVKDILCFNNE